MRDIWMFTALVYSSVLQKRGHRTVVTLIKTFFLRMYLLTGEWPLCRHKAVMLTVHHAAGTRVWPSGY